MTHTESCLMAILFLVVSPSCHAYFAIGAAE